MEQLYEKNVTLAFYARRGPQRYNKRFQTKSEHQAHKVVNKASRALVIS